MPCRRYTPMVGPVPRAAAGARSLAWRNRGRTTPAAGCSKAPGQSSRGPVRRLARRRLRGSRRGQRRVWDRGGWPTVPHRDWARPRVRQSVRRHRLRESARRAALPRSCRRCERLAHGLGDAGGLRRIAMNTEGVRLHGDSTTGCRDQPALEQRAHLCGRRLGA